MTLEEIWGMLEKATPGPWTLNRHGYPAVYSPHEFVEASDEGAICGIWDPEGHPYQGANAALIAAAPEIAALLVRAVETLIPVVALSRDKEQEWVSIQLNHAWMKSARALLRELGVDA